MSASRKSAVVRCLKASGQVSAGKRLDRCGTWYMQECPECGAEVGPKQRFCKVRVCPTCAARESAKRFAVIRSTVIDLNDNKRGMWRMITLTAVNPYDGGDPARLERQLKACGKALYKLWRNVLSKAGPWAGAAAGLEVGPSGNVHVHILHFGDYVQFKGVQNTWRRIMKAHRIKIRKVRGNDRLTLLGAAAEVTKYLCDPNKTDARIVASANKASRRLRCYRTYGSLFNKADNEFECTSTECPVCLHDGMMNEGRGVCPEEADAWLCGMSYVRRTGSKYPESLLFQTLPGLCW